MIELDTNGDWHDPEARIYYDAEQDIVFCNCGASVLNACEPCKREGRFDRMPWLAAYTRGAVA